MASISSNSSRNAVRVAPQQERSTRRLAGFLDAAEALFAEAGFEATTMTAIAERSGSSIGALYNYFPDKQAVAVTLLEHYGQQIEAHWRPLMEQAKTLSHSEFAEMYLEGMIEFVRTHPAYVQLVTAPIRLRRDPEAKRAMRMTIANAFRTKNPALTSDQALLAANVSLQIIRGMTSLYADAAAKDKPAVVVEFKKVMAAYLAGVLASQ